MFSGSTSVTIEILPADDIFGECGGEDDALIAPTGACRRIVPQPMRSPPR